MEVVTLGHTLTYQVQRRDFVQILHVRGNHWLTVSNIGCLSDQVNVFDSLYAVGSVYSEAQKQIAALVFSDAKQLNLNVKSVQVQKGSDDCGVFAVRCICHFSLCRRRSY